jgi:beta-galactosidase
LKGGEAAVEAQAIASDEVTGAASAPIVWPKAELPARKPERSFPVQARALAKAATRPGEGGPMMGRFTRTFNYSGPSGTIVHVETGARAGRSVYMDSPVVFAELPQAVVGADWVQASSLEAGYHAVDLMQLSVVDGARVWIAHDDTVPRPGWLLEKFKPTGAKVAIAGRTMSVFERSAVEEDTLTLGANAEAPLPEGALMYVVFVKSG